MSKDISVQYLTDESGNKQAVVIPFDEWQKILEELAVLSEFRVFKEGFLSAFKEVEEIKKGKSPRITLREFLNEN